MARNQKRKEEYKPKREVLATAGKRKKLGEKKVI